ncbi:uncharacterized protein LOC121390679 [Gigantopelta aegis]|uniref:uncharacterized protein LOC121390679 n=1 Tax=Gigantopelta aegis TaxID=1735272 RepID=UPI001B88882D|nr:uncharacterized protein LOC121390679 [Gigantopelta aegis]
MDVSGVVMHSATVMNVLYHDPSPEVIILITMLSVFMVVGTVGNGLVIFVFQKVREKSTAHLFIITLAIIDLFTCMVIIPFTIVVEYLRYDIRYDFLCKMYQFLITSKVPLSSFVMVAIAFDRYFCICHPLRIIVTLQRTKVTIIFLSIFAGCLGVLTAMGFGVYQVVTVPDYSSVHLLPNASSSTVQPDMFNWIGPDGESPHQDNINKIVMLRVYSHFAKNNISDIFSKLKEFRGPWKSQVIYVGVCQPTQVLINFSFLHVYQKIYSSLFLVCLVIVGVLYALIYKFIISRRSRKLERRLVLCAYVNGDNPYEGTRLTLLNGQDDERHGDEKSVEEEDKSPKTDEKYYYGTAETKQCGSDERVNNGNNKKSSRKDRAAKRQSIVCDADKLREETRSANIKTAMMLFTVTLVFVIAFLPAWMMAFRIVPTVIVVFYLYFSYNVANPFIYAFMNHIFKDNLQKMFRC